MPRHHHLLFISLIVLVQSPSGASANPILYVRAQVGGEGGPGGGVSNFGPGPVTSTRNIEDHLGTASARAEFGTLGAYARVDTESLCSPVVYWNCDREGNSAFATASWSDDFIITSAILAADTPVVFNYSLSLEGSVALSNSYVRGSYSPNAAVYGASASLRLYGAPSGVIGVERHESVEDGYDFINGGFYLEEVSRDDGSERGGTMTLLVGRTYTFRQELIAQALVRNMGNASAMSDYYGTGRFVFSPDGAEFGYVTASGTRYRPLTQVPEPLTLSLVLLGAIGVSMCRRR